MIGLWLVVFSFLIIVIGFFVFIFKCLVFKIVVGCLLRFRYFVFVL